MAVARVPARSIGAGTRLLAFRGPDASEDTGGEEGPPAAASSVSSLPLRTFVATLAVAVVVLALAWWVAYYQWLPVCFRTGQACESADVYLVSSEVSIFAGLFVLALAVERLLEPFSRWLVPGSVANKDERDKAEAAADGAEQDSVARLADAQANVDKDRQRAVIIHWGVASAVAVLVAGKLNLLLLTAIGAPGSARPSAALDLLVTALVVGAGTKPLHDLVSRIEKSKESAQDPASTGGSK